MSQLPLLDRDDRPAGNGAGLRFVADLVDRLAAAADPRDALDAALPEIAALVGVAACRMRPAAGDGGAPHGMIEAVGGADHGHLGPSEAALLGALSRVAALAVAKAELETRLVGHRRIGRDLDKAAELQQSLQPTCVPDDLPIWGVNLPARELSGDFFDFFPLGDDRIAFTLGDVSGKGINAAILMTKAVSLFRCLAKRISSPARLLETINAELCETAARGMFVSMIAGQYCPASGRVTFANGGHQPPLLRRPDRSYDTFPAAAPPLGILPAITLSDQEIALAGGEFYVFTDGLTEYRYADGELLGVAGLIQLVEAVAEQSPARRLKSILDTLDREGGWVARDDITVLAIDDSWVRHIAIDEAGVARAATGSAEAE